MVVGEVFNDNIGIQVHKEDVEYSSHGIEETSDMEGAVRRRAYPPFISCKTTYSKKLKKSGEPTEVSLVIEGAKEKSMEFLCPAYKYKSTGTYALVCTAL